MRSYYAHLDTMAMKDRKAIEQRPVYRSSAIFPVIQHPGLSTRVLFLGYWILKRHIREITCVVSLRSILGELLSRRVFQITEAKTYRLEAKEEMKHAGLEDNIDFEGSLELEFFSTSNLVFPYPAVVVNYYGDSFSTVVHTAQRVYNDFEDARKNSQTSVPESGFNIYADDQREPFLSFINGPEETEASEIKLEFFNCSGDVLTQTLNTGRLLPYEMKMLYPARHSDLKAFLKGKEGACKAFFHLNWIFPRLVVGNIQREQSIITVTHSYYDCSEAMADSDYWRQSEPQWHPASLMVPLTTQGEEYTNIYFYPIYSPSAFTIDIEIYDSLGKQLGKKQNATTVNSKDHAFIKIALKEICRELGIEHSQPLAARILAHPCEGSRIPSRIKLGLDIGNTTQGTPCNICTNLQPFNPSVESKQQSFKWAPLLTDSPHASAWIMNSTPRINYAQEAVVDVTFFRENDDKTLMRQLIIPPHGFVVILPDDDMELHNFLKDKIGWFSAASSNPYTTVYYLSTSPSGVVGGDHGF